VRQNISLCGQPKLTMFSSMRGRAQHGIALSAGTLAALSHTVREAFN
jgi:hypothetical protein